MCTVEKLAHYQDIKKLDTQCCWIINLHWTFLLLTLPKWNKFCKTCVVIYKVFPFNKLFWRQVEVISDGKHINLKCASHTHNSLLWVIQCKQSLNKCLSFNIVRKMVNFWLASRIRRFIIWFVTSYTQRKNTEFPYMDSNLRRLALQFSRIYFIIYVRELYSQFGHYYLCRFVCGMCPK